MAKIYAQHVKQIILNFVKQTHSDIHMHQEQVVKKGKHVKKGKYVKKEKHVKKGKYVKKEKLKIDINIL
jgi:hypothetical protein